MAGSVWLEFSMRCSPMESMVETTVLLEHVHNAQVTTTCSLQSCRHTTYVGDLISIDLCPPQLPHWLLWSLAGLWPGIDHLL